MGGGAASGKMGAMVASHNKGGQYLRARTVPTNPRTALQNAVRGAFSGIASMWQTLTDSARAAWANWGTVVGTTNRLGDNVPISGIAAFQRANVLRAQAGYDLVLDAPPAPLALIPSGDLTVDFSYGDTTGTLTLSGGALPLASETNSFYALFLSPPFSLGRTSAPGNTRLAMTLPGNSTGGAHSFTLPWSVSGSANQMEATVNFSSVIGQAAGPFRVTSAHV
jgi:hypothetical protein